ncbi:VirB5, partial [Pseudomonas savastanoi pv. glycinea str. race 4]
PACCPRRSARRSGPGPVYPAHAEGECVGPGQAGNGCTDTAKDAIRETAQQYNHYKSIITGNDMLGGFLNDPALNKVMPMGDWADVYGTARDIASLRDRYGLTSDNASVQAKFDQMMSVADALERNYNASTERVKNAEFLRARLNEVTTPQQKEDLQLR